MKAVRLALILMGPHLASGCADGRLFGFGSRQIRGRIVGAVCEASTPQDYAFVDFANILIDGEPLAQAPVLRANDVVEVELHSQTAVMVDLEREETVEAGVTRIFDFNVLLGADLGTGSLVGTGYLTATEPTMLDLERGWSFAWGIMPRFRGRLALALTETSAIAIQIVEAPSYEERVYLIQGRAAVSCLGSTAPPVIISTAYDFVRVALNAAGACEVSTPATTPPAMRDEFLRPACKQAAATGVFACTPTP